MTLSVGSLPPLNGTFFNFFVFKTHRKGLKTVFLDQKHLFFCGQKNLIAFKTPPPFMTKVMIYYLHFFGGALPYH